MIGWQTRKFAQCYPHNPMLINKFPLKEKNKQSPFFFRHLLETFLISHALIILKKNGIQQVLKKEDRGRARRGKKYEISTPS